MKKRTVLFLLVIWLAGCASAQEADQQTKWVNSEQGAIEDGIRYENITKDDILDKIDLNGEKVVVFRFSDSEGREFASLTSNGKTANINGTAI
ncbi:hypothetical protein AAGG52_02990 [Bacillus licheniformis]